MIDKILGIFKSNAVKQIGDVVNGISTTDEEKSKVKNDLTQIVMSMMVAMAQVQGEIIKSETNGNLLQRSWRPIVMLTFAGILVAKWLGYTSSDIPLELELNLMSLLKIGLGGYVAGRSLEKIATTVTKNVDISFLKKRDRKDGFTQ